MATLDSEPIRTDARGAERARRVGERACAVCGETNPFAFAVDRPILELHHIFGEANDAASVVALCLTHHALASELQDHVKRKIAPYKYPRKVEFVEALPRTVSGKISRRLLRDAEFRKLSQPVFTGGSR